MRRQESQPPRPTAGFLSVPLFNRKKMNRVPLTSAPSENEFFPNSEFMANTSSETSGDLPQRMCTSSGTYGCYQASGPSFGTSKNNLWNTQSIRPSAPAKQHVSNITAPGPAPALRHNSPLSHPYKVQRSKMEQPSNPLRQQESSFTSKKTEYHHSDRVQSKPTARNAFTPMGQQAFNRPANATYSQQSRSLPAPVPQNNSWKFTNSFGTQRPPFEGNRSENNPPAARQTHTQDKTKPAMENSLRILTAVIKGMRHWSQFKDKVPYLFELFATLDSAVTFGHHGAKSFLMRDGKEVVQCVFYENEQELPRLIRGQVHRCVGNYDRSRDVLTCVSVRPGLPSELRNAQEAVKACDEEMRALVKSLSEV